MQTQIFPTADVPPDAGALCAAAGGQSDMDDFIYLISHDVRASVRALIELPQWIEEDLAAGGVTIEGEVATSIELMNRHTGRLDRMLVDLLAYSRVGRMQSTRQLSIGAALAEVLETLQIPTGFKLERDLAVDEVMLGDRDLPLLLTALVSNAVKHHDRTEGRIVLSSRAEGERLVISAADDGPGIEPRFHERIFKPMTTLRPRDEVEGSGLGLAHVAKIAQFYGGSAGVAPSPFGRGLRVDVALPRPVSS